MHFNLLGCALALTAVAQGLVVDKRSEGELSSYLDESLIKQANKVNVAKFGELGKTERIIVGEALKVAQEGEKYRRATAWLTMSDIDEETGAPSRLGLPVPAGPPSLKAQVEEQIEYLEAKYPNGPRVEESEDDDNENAVFKHNFETSAGDSKKPKIVQYFEQVTYLFDLAWRTEEEEDRDNAP